MGRIGRGEAMAFSSIDARTQVYVASRPAYADATLLDPHQARLDGLGLLEGARYLASGYWHWDEALPPKHSASEGASVVAGIPPTGHLYLRGSARDGLAIRGLVRETIRTQRREWGLAQLDLERYAPAFG